MEALSPADTLPLINYKDNFLQPMRLKRLSNRISFVLITAEDFVCLRTLAGPR